MDRVRVFLVDDNDDFLDGVAECVAHPTQCLIVGRAHSGQETLERLEKASPDLVLVDMTLPDMSGLELTRRIKAKAAATRVVLMTFHDSAAARLVAIASGADGWISEATLRDRLAPLIDELFSGSVEKQQI